MITTLITEILAFILGRKYYANIINTKGTDRIEICSFIFRNKKQALSHKQSIENTSSFAYIETISFRSHKQY